MRPNILFILHVPPPIHGAAMVGKYVQESTRLRSQLSADFINLSTSTCLKESGKGSLKKIINLFTIQIKVLKALLSRKYDLCYMTLNSCGPGFYKDLLVVILLKLFNQKLIYHFHNKGVAVSSRNFINNHLYRFAFAKSQSILLSQYLYPDISKFVKQENIYYCANGIPDIYSNYIPPSAGLKNDKQLCKLLFLSNMMAEKGVYTLLAACKLLKKRKLKFECHFVGAWSDISETLFHNMVEKEDIADVVFSHGPKYCEEKLPYFLGADIFLFPTYHETFGLVNLEAMQFGLPIVASDEGGIPDIVVDGVTGFLVPRKNQDALAEKLEMLILNPDLRLRMGKAGAERYKEYFTLQHFEIRITNILKAAANKVININRNKQSI